MHLPSRRGRGCQPCVRPSIGGVAIGGAGNVDASDIAVSGVPKLPPAMIERSRPGIAGAAVARGCVEYGIRSNGPADGENASTGLCGAPAGMFAISGQECPRPPGASAAGSAVAGGGRRGRPWQAAAG